MLTGNWLEIGKLNHIAVAIAGKRVALRCTVSQVERFQALSEKNRESGTTPEPLSDPSAVPSGAYTRLVMDSVDIVEIALNPLPNQVDFAREVILDQLDTDQVKILARVWMDRKLFAPRLEPDPILGPQEKGR